MDIKPVDTNLKTLLSSGFYRIPRFQRPYSWDKENVDDFWNDTVAGEDFDYFIGSFVVYRERSNRDVCMIVDGQQRLTTITLTLAATRNALDDLGQGGLAGAVQKLIERQDIDDRMQFVLQSDTPYFYLQEYIQKRGAAQLPAQKGEEQESLQLAFSLLNDRIASTLKSVDEDHMIRPNKKNGVKRDKLVQIRDRILRLQLILIELSNEDDAYLIFETLNTRGKDLGISDLVKNHLTRLLKPANKAVDVAREKWNSIRSTFDASAADINMNRFIYHSWLSRYPYIGEKRLYKELRKRVGRSNAQAHLDDLVKDASLYRRILEPDSYAWPKQDREIQNAVRALNLFRVVQPIPMTLAILRDFNGGRLTGRQTRDALRKMEDFHVQFTAVTAQRTGGGTARMYAASAEDLLAAKDKNARAQVIKAFIQKLRQRVPSYQEFEANFLEIVYRRDSTKQRSLVHYILSRLDAAQRTGAVVDYQQMTIEHICPESPDGTWPATKNVGMVGNLVLVHSS